MVCLDGLAPRNQGSSVRGGKEADDEPALPAPGDGGRIWASAESETNILLSEAGPTSKGGQVAPLRPFYVLRQERLSFPVGPL